MVAVEEVTVRCVVGRKFAWLGGAKNGEASGSLSSADDFAPSSLNDGEYGASFGVSRSSSAGTMMDRLAGDGGVAESGVGLRSASTWLELLMLREGDAGMLRLLEGLANGLVECSAVWLIWLGRLANGLAFSGDSELGLVGESAAGVLVGEELGVVPRTVAGDALFCRRNGDCRPFGLSKGDGRSAYR